MYGSLSIGPDETPNLSTEENEADDDFHLTYPPASFCRLTWASHLSEVLNVASSGVSY
jgi:hypothetical protein